MQSLLVDYTGKAFTRTPQQIRDTVNATSGHNIWTPRYRMLDRRMNPVTMNGSAPVNGDLADVTQFGAVMSCVVENQTTRSVHRSATIGFAEIPGFTFNPLIHRLQVLIDYWDGAGNLLFEVPIGIFAHVLPDRTLAESGVTWAGTWLDETQTVKRKKFINSYDVAAGTNYVTAIQRILTMDYLPASKGGTGTTPAGLDDSGPNIPLSRLNITPTTLTTPTTIPFTRKDNKLDAVNQLLAAINYYPLWVDEVGTFHSSPIPYYTNDKPQLGWTYTTLDNTSTIKPGSVVQRYANSTDLANIVVVENTNNGAAPLFSVKYNTGDSLLSLANWGDSAFWYEEDSKIPDQASCDRRALILLQQHAMTLEEMTLTTFVNPFLQSHDQLALFVSDPNGVPQITTQGTYYFEETAWKLDIDSKTMDHTISRQIAV